MRIGGLASGMDIDQIVKDLMTAERIPFDKLTQKKIWTEWQKDAYRDFNLSLSNLQSSAGNLRLQSSFNAYSATSSDPTKLTASPTSNAVNGSYEVNVVSVSSSAKIRSSGTILKADGTTPAKSSDLIGTTESIVGGTGKGKMTVAYKDAQGLDATVEIEITSTMTYADVAKKLQDSTAGKSMELRASFDDTTSRFFISTKGMGDNQNFSLSFTNSDGTANSVLSNKVINVAGKTDISTNDAADALGAPTVDYMTKAFNGEVEFDGITVANLTTNKTTINGLTLNLVQIGTSTITVQSDTAKPLESIKNLVEKYNETIAEIEKKLVEKRYPDFQPLTDEQKEAMSDKEVEMWEEKSRSGLLRNDPILKTVLQDLRRAFMDPVEGIANGNINLLSEIGINTGHYSEGGKLTIDEDKLKEALTNNPDEVMDLFTKTEAGIGDRVYKELDDVVTSLSERAGNPKFSVDNSSITKRINEMNDEISRWQDRLVQVEDRYWRQFTAMEKALSQMNSQSSWMQQNMFGGM